MRITKVFYLSKDFYSVLLSSTSGHEETKGCSRHKAMKANVNIEQLKLDLSDC